MTPATTLFCSSPSALSAPSVLPATWTAAAGRSHGRCSTTRRRRFVVELSEFSGPLDLLLSLIRDEQVDIYDIPIARIAEQFLARIRTLELDEAADYLEMAARLLRIKAQMLLPRKRTTRTWEDPRAELVRRLLEYQQMREVVDVLERARRGPARDASRARTCPQSTRRRRRRRSRCRSPSCSPPSIACCASRASRTCTTSSRARSTSMARSATMRARARAARPRALARRRPDGAEPWQVLSALLALLELARRGELRLAQLAPFATVEITRDSASQAA